MDEEIKFIDKEIQRLEDITKKTYYRLVYFRKIRERMENKTVRKDMKITQLTMFGT